MFFLSGLPVALWPEVCGLRPVRRAVTLHLTSVVWTVTGLTLAISIVVCGAIRIN